MIVYISIVAVALLTFIISGFWWLSGHRGGSSHEAGPIGVTLMVTAIYVMVALLMGWI